MEIYTAETEAVLEVLEAVETTEVKKVVELAALGTVMQSPPSKQKQRL